MVVTILERREKLMKEIVVSSLVGYLFGCFQTSIFIGRLFKRIDIREHGSQNAGASNTTVVLGLPYGLATAFFDILKSVIAVLVVKSLYPGNALLPVLAGIGAVMGHIFPVFFGFKGGKGVASLAGAVLALNIKAGLIVVVASAIAALVTDYVVAGSTTIYILFVAMLALGDFPRVAIGLSLGLLVIALVKHRSNYKNILNKQELKIRSSLKGEETEHRVK